MSYFGEVAAPYQKIRCLREIKEKSGIKISLVEVDGVEMIMKEFSDKWMRPKEFFILLGLRHENIIPIKYFSVSLNDKKLTLFFEKSETDFLQFLSSGQIMTYEKRYRYLKQIALALAYLHSMKLIHFDLKTENILLDREKEHCYLIDFGSSEYLSSDGHSYVRNPKCTATHRPPEAFNDEVATHTTKFDVWSFGIVAYEILNNRPIYLDPYFPKYDASEAPSVYDEKIYRAITNDVFRKRIVEKLPEQLRGCLEFDPEKRPDVVELLEIL